MCMPAGAHKTSASQEVSWRKGADLVGLLLRNINQVAITRKPFRLLYSLLQRTISIVRWRQDLAVLAAARRAPFFVGFSKGPGYCATGTGQRRKAVRGQMASVNQPLVEN